MLRPRMLVAVPALVLAACGGAADVAACPTDGAPFDTAKLYIEHNATDEDTGVHGAFGVGDWTRLCLTDPDGTVVLDVSPRGALGELAMADLLFESREPPNSEVAIDEIEAAFPEGDYLVSAVARDGSPLSGLARFTHAIPAAPVLVSPQVGDEEDAPTLATDDLVVAWQPVTRTIDGQEASISGYQVIVTDEDRDDPDGWARPVFDVHVGPDVTSLDVSSAFLQPATLYELEVLALEASGNQTITLGFFRTS